MNIKATSFGTMETIIEKDGNILAELLTFNKEGRGHSHILWEICYIIEGNGVIVKGEEKINVKEGDVCKIPPKTKHWMIPDNFLKILLVYSKTD